MLHHPYSVPNPIMVSPPAPPEDDAASPGDAPPAGPPRRELHAPTPTPATSGSGIPPQSVSPDARDDGGGGGKDDPTAWRDEDAEYYDEFVALFAGGTDPQPGAPIAGLGRVSEDSGGEEDSDSASSSAVRSAIGGIASTSADAPAMGWSSDLRAPRKMVSPCGREIFYVGSGPDGDAGAGYVAHKQSAALDWEVRGVARTLARENGKRNPQRPSAGTGPGAGAKRAGSALRCQNLPNTVPSAVRCPKPPGAGVEEVKPAVVKCPTPLDAGVQRVKPAVTRPQCQSKDATDCFYDSIGKWAETTFSLPGNNRMGGTLGNARGPSMGTGLGVKEVKPVVRCQSDEGMQAQPNAALPVVTCHSNDGRQNRPKTTPPVSPQCYLNELLSRHGYSTGTYSAHDCGYRTEPTDLQLASYGTAVLGAIRTGDAPTLSALLRSGLSPNPCNKFSEGTLAMACKRGRHDLFRCQVEAGADVEVADDFGRTPLHHAAWAMESCFETVEMILDGNVNMLRITDQTGLAPLEYLTKDKWADWIEFLKSKEEKYWPDREWVRSEAEETPRAVRAGGRDRPASLPDPGNALPTEMAALVSNGMIRPDEVKRMSGGYRPSNSDDAASGMFPGMGKVVHPRFPGPAAAAPPECAAGSERISALTEKLASGAVRASLLRPWVSRAMKRMEPLAGYSEGDSAKKTSDGGCKRRIQTSLGKGTKRRTTASRCA